MTPVPRAPGVVDLGELGFDGGAHVLVKLALADLPAGARLGVRGRHPDLRGGLAAWCRQSGHRLQSDGVGAAAGNDSACGDDGVDGGVVACVEAGRSSAARWVDAEQGGRPDPSEPEALAARPAGHWGLAARGAWVEAGGPEPSFPLADRDELWADRAPRLYAQAAGAQWDPASAIDWSAPIGHDEAVERAVVQVMTFLVENEQAALVVPARFLGLVHPHFREIQQVLAVITADEARHVEVFTRRARLGGQPLGLSTVGGRASLQTLLDEPDFATASFLLSTMGEGTFLSLLGFLERQAPDPVTRQVTRLARQDEARHVAFSLGHLERHARLDPSVRPRLARAVERRYDALRKTAGLNDEVFDALVLLAAGSPTAPAVARGWTAVQALQRDMDEGRRSRLSYLGFSPAEAETISALHTRNFM